MASSEHRKLTEELIDNLDDPTDGLDILEEHSIDDTNLTSLHEIKKRLKEHLRDQIRDQFKCQNCNLKEEDIEELEDIGQAVSLLKDHRIEPKGIKELDGAIEKLTEHLQQKQLLESYDTDQVARVVRNLIEENTFGREQLKTKLTEVTQYVRGIPKERAEDIEKQLPTLEEDFKALDEALQNDKCTLMIAGETGAGKSCLLNLLLGEITSELLMVNNLPSTSALCEIKYGADRMLKAYPNNEVNSTPEIVPLDPETAPEVIAQYTSETRGGELKYNKVEINWPVEWIKQGITITDTPGIGESESLTNLVKDYIPQASGFIYVLNTTNAGGINPEELEDLLFYHMNRAGLPKEVADDENETNVPVEKVKFDPRCAIFVCNKWDQVDSDEVDEVKGYVRKKLNKVWKDFDYDNQVFFISASKIQRELKDGHVPQEYRKLLTGIQNLLPVGFRSKMDKQFWNMFHIMDRSMWVLKNFIISGEKKERMERRDKYLEAQKKLVDLENKPDLAKDQMRKILNSEVESALKQLKEHIESQEVQERLQNWKESECPYHENLDRLITIQNSKVEQRIKKEIQQFEEDERLFEKIQKKLIETFRTIFTSVETELSDIENDILEGQKEVRFILEHFANKEDEEPKSVKPSMKKNKLFKMNKKPLWTPFASFINKVALSRVTKRKLNKQRKVMQKQEEEEQIKKVTEYRKNKGAAMAVLTQDIAAELVKSENLKSIILHKLSLLEVNFEKLVQKIPPIIDANKRMISAVIHELESDIDNSHYVPLYTRGLDLQDSMNFVYMTSIRSFSIDLSQIKNKKRIGAGFFGIVYKGELIRNGQTQLVAVKRYKKKLTEGNVTEFLSEELNLMRINSPQIVEFIGTTVKRTDQKVYPAMILGYCPQTFNNVIHDPELFTAPGSIPISDDRRIKSEQRAARFAHEISMGLASMHKLGLVHRDLKPENILVDQKEGKEVIKLCDLGLAKKEKDMLNTNMGTPLYMAPEIWNENMQDRSVDIFSYGLILWEIWYGRLVYPTYNIGNYQQFCESPFIEYSPPQEWREIMTRCWAHDTHIRPSIQECCNVFSTLYTK